MMKFFDAYEARHLVALRHGKEKPREPLRTVTELAKELGVSTCALGRLLSEPGAPPPVFNNSRKSVAHRAKWYSPSQVRKWIKSRSAKQTEAAA